MCHGDAGGGKAGSAVIHRDITPGDIFYQTRLPQGESPCNINRERPSIDFAERFTAINISVSLSSTVGFGKLD